MGNNLNTINGFLNGLKQMVAALNVKAEQAKAFDPLQEISFTLEAGSKTLGNRIAPAVELPIHVRITAGYLSGGGIESSYVINDEVTLSIGPGKIESVVFVRDTENIDQPPVDLGEVSLAKFLVRIENFLSVTANPNMQG